MYELYDELRDEPIVSATSWPVAERAMDAACDALDAQLAANAEGAFGIRMHLEVYAVDDGDGTRRWVAGRVHAPAAPAVARAWNLVDPI